MSTRLRRSGNQPKRCRRDVAGNIEIPRLRSLIAENINAAVIFRRRAHQEIIEHFLHVVSRRHRFFNRGFAFCKETGQQQRAFHLCARHRWAVLNSMKRPAVDAQRRRSLRTFSNDAGAHLTKRRDHSVHWALGHAGISHQPTLEFLGDPGLSKRPMDRVIAPLCEMGASVVAEGPEGTAPLRIHGGSLRGIQYRPSAASAQVKSALLLAGLFAKGKTTVEEPVPTRNHMEKMLKYFLVRTAAEDGRSATVFGDQVPESRDFEIPGDISSAAFWLVAAAAQSRGHLLIRDVGLNDTRTAMLGVLIRMGAHIREAVEDIEHVEPRGVVEVTGMPLKATVIQGKEVPQLIDELPVLSIAAVL